MILAQLGKKLWDLVSFGLKTGRSESRHVGQPLKMIKNSKLMTRTIFGIRLRYVISYLEKGFADKVQSHYRVHFFKKSCLKLTSKTDRWSVFKTCSGKIFP